MAETIDYKELCKMLCYKAGYENSPDKLSKVVVYYHISLEEAKEYYHQGSVQRLEDIDKFR